MKWSHECIPPPSHYPFSTSSPHPLSPIPHQVADVAFLLGVRTPLPHELRLALGGCEVRSPASSACLEAPQHCGTKLLSVLCCRHRHNAQPLHLSSPLAHSSHPCVCNEPACPWMLFLPAPRLDGFPFSPHPPPSFAWLFHHMACSTRCAACSMLQRSRTPCTWPRCTNLSGDWCIGGLQRCL